MAIGVKISRVFGLSILIVFITLICAAFTGLGLILATKLGNTEGFMATMNLILFSFL
jgi:hypothetical protein